MTEQDLIDAGFEKVHVSKEDSGDDEDYKEEPHQPNCQTNFVMCYLLSV